MAFLASLKPRKCTPDPERLLVAHIFWRATRDIMMTDEATKPHFRRDAEAWLFADSEEVGSAKWYAYLADMEWFLRKCKRMVRE
jgi:hypothetical protein